MSIDDFSYTCSGSEQSDFMVSLPLARSDDTYQVTATLAGVASIYGIDLPNTTGSDRTVSAFRVVTTSPVAAGDRIEFHVFGATTFAQGLDGAFVTAGTFTTAFGSGLVWTISSSGVAFVPIRVIQVGFIFVKLLLNSSHSGTTATYSLLRGNDGTVLSSSTSRAGGTDTVTLTTPYALGSFEYLLLKITGGSSISDFTSLVAVVDF